MDLSHLKTFLLAAELNSFTQAAKRQAYSQSAVSQQMLHLEQALGAKLFERYPRSVALTPAGEILRKHAQDIVSRLQAANAELKDLGVGIQGLCRIGASHATVAHVLPPLLAGLAKSLPGVRLRLELGSDRELLNALDDAELDVAILEDAPPRQKAKGRVERPGFEDQLVPVVGRGLARRAGSRMQAKQLATMPIIAWSRGRAVWPKVEQELDGLGCSPDSLNVVMELEDVAATKHLAAQDVGVGFVPVSACQRELGEGTLFRLDLQGYRGTRRSTILHVDTGLAASVVAALAPLPLRELVG
jgi:DNA-binding transcriptional LysR family regulator